MIFDSIATQIQQLDRL